MVTSTGVPLDGYFSFEMGTFNSGFTPTWENFAQWESNWNVIDRVYDPTPDDPNDGDPQGWNTLGRFYAATAQLEPTGESNSPEASPTHQFVMGEQVYLWVFNDKAQVPGTEWALITNNLGTGNATTEWQIPDLGDTINSYYWQLSDADTAIVGGVNDTRGGGNFSMNPGSYAIQTAVVPEPGSLVLVFLAGLPLLSRRRPKSC